MEKINIYIGIGTLVILVIFGLITVLQIIKNTKCEKCTGFKDIYEVEKEIGLYQAIVDSKEGKDFDKHELHYWRRIKRLEEIKTKYYAGKLFFE